MKTKYIIGLLLIMVGLQSCQDALTEDPKTFISLSNFYQTESDARTATDAIYHALHTGTGNSLYGRFWAAVDIATDDVVSRVNKTTYNDWFTHTLSPTNVWLESYNQYSGLWTGVGRANDVLRYVPDIEMDEVEKQAILGEARALRALFYLHLTKGWGDAPLLTKSVESVQDFVVPRSSVDEIYDQIIIPDLLFAEEHCKDALHQGRVTKWTAKVILADAYVTRAGWRRTSQGQFVQGDASNWALARDVAKSIIDSSPHELIKQAYVDGFHTTPACGVAWLEGQPYSVESMFEIGSVSIGGLGSFLSRDCNPNANGVNYWGGKNDRPLVDEGIDLRVRDLGLPAGNVNVGGLNLPSPDLAAAFEPGDERREWSLLTRYVTPAGDVYLCQPTFRKHMDINFFLGDPDTSFQYTQNNFMLYRYADALLLYAEAQNEADGAPNSDAYSALNEVRNRAGLASLSGLSQQEFREAVWQERRVEFAGEMKRRFDLIRTNRLFTETENMLTIWTTDLGAVIEYSINNTRYGSAPWPDHEWLFPIPQTEMNLTSKFGWEQNEGYIGSN